VAEATQSLPQIRFSSLAEIIRYRPVELHDAWKVATSMGLLTLLVELSPILLSAISISSYILEQKSLRPSILFTSLALLSELHNSLRSLRGF
jgi:hypothetical protein